MVIESQHLTQTCARGIKEQHHDFIRWWTDFWLWKTSKKKKKGGHCSLSGGILLWHTHTRAWTPTPSCAHRYTHSFCKPEENDAGNLKWLIGMTVSPPNEAYRHMYLVPAAVITSESLSNIVCLSESWRQRDGRKGLDSILIAPKWSIWVLLSSQLATKKRPWAALS